MLTQFDRYSDSIRRQYQNHDVHTDTNPDSSSTQKQRFSTGK